MSWYNPFSWFSLPRDPVDRCGYYGFSLPESHPFTRACTLHDYAFDQARDGKEGKSKNAEDIALFWRWALIAKNQTTEEAQLDLIWDICKYWPLANMAGSLLWKGKDGEQRSTEEAKKG